MLISKGMIVYVFNILIIIIVGIIGILGMNLFCIFYIIGFLKLFSCLIFRIKNNFLEKFDNFKFY